jgi:glycerate dehydrogenase
MHRIVFLERNTFSVEFRRPSFDHEWIEYPSTLQEQLVERARQATILISNKLALAKETLAQLPDLKLIAIAATGFNHIDLEYCRERGIRVCNGRNYAVRSVPEHVLALLFALRRNLINYHTDVRAGRWQLSEQFCLHSRNILDLNASTLGIIGYGGIGQAVEKLAKGVGMRVLVGERKNADAIRHGRTAFEEVLQTSDAITLHCPLDEETKHLIGSRELSLMRRDAVLINTARGGLVDEQALANALEKGSIGGAAIDVLTDEPPRDGNVLLDLNLPNLIVTPHVAWASQEAMQSLADQTIENIEAFVRGEQRNVIV